MHRKFGAGEQDERRKGEGAVETWRELEDRALERERERERVRERERREKGDSAPPRPLIQQEDR